jgi:FecR protein
MSKLFIQSKSVRWAGLALGLVLLSGCGLLPAASKATSVPVAAQGATQAVVIIPAKLAATATKAVAAPTKAAPTGSAPTKSAPTAAPSATSAGSQATTAPTAEQFGILGDTTKKVSVKSSLETDAHEGVFGESLPKGAVLNTDDTGRARILLQNGSTLRLAPNTQLALTDRQEPTTGNILTQLDLLVGKVWAILGRGANESLTIETPIGVGAVRGSYMSVEYIPGKLDDPTDDILIITCLEGDCSVTTPLGTVNLTTGQKITITGKGNPPVGPVPMTQQDIQDWLDNNVEILILFGINGNGQAPTSLGPITLQLPGGGTIVIVLGPDTPTPTATPTPSATSSSGGGGSTLPTAAPASYAPWPSTLGSRSGGLAVVFFGLVVTVAGGGWLKRRK